MSFAIIISKSIIQSKTEKNKVFHTLVLSDASTAFVDEAVYNDMKNGQAVVLTKKKYKSGDVWKTSTIVTPVNIVS